jgi:hypothetical protein
MLLRGGRRLIARRRRVAAREKTARRSSGHDPEMRIAALVCVIGLGLFGCSGGEIAPSDASPPSFEAGATTPLPEEAAHTAVASANACTRLPAADAAPAAVGGPCIPENEEDTTFGGFAEQEVSTVSNTPQCGANDVCLVNHFLGRVTCPYGQDAQGLGPDGSAGCLSLGSCEPVRPVEGEPVPRQCPARSAADAVYCSCRCANVNGGTNGGTYCSCPSGTTCTQLISSLGPLTAGETDPSGAYCIKTGTQFDGGCATAL